MLTYLLLGSSFAFAAAVQPGPFLAYIISQVLSRGWKSVLPAAFAPLISDIPIFILVMLVLSSVSDNMIHVLQIGGGLLLFYMAFKTFNDMRKRKEQEVLPPESDKTTLFKAALVNFINPSPYLGWTLIMGPVFLEAWQKNSLYGIGLIASFYTTMIFSLGTLIIIFGTATKLGPKITKIAAYVSVVGLVAFACYELWLGVSYFV